MEASRVSEIEVGVEEMGRVEEQVRVKEEQGGIRLVVPLAKTKAPALPEPLERTANDSMIVVIESSIRKRFWGK